MDSIIFSNIDLGKIFINETISKNSFAIIKKMANNLNCISYQIIHDKNDLNKGVLCISKNNDYKQSPAYMLKLNNNLLIPMKRNHSFVVSTLPTIFNKYNMLFRCYHANNGPLIFMIYNTKVNDIYVNLYGRSALVKNS